MDDAYVAVTSRSFSKNEYLKNELRKKYKNIKFNDKGLSLKGNDLLQFLTGCHKAIIGLEKFDHTSFKQLPNLKVLSRFGVGIDGLDFKAMSENKVKLGWTPGTNSLSVAELTLTFMLALVRQSFSAFNTLKNGEWQKFKGAQLTGKTIGIIGANHIGKEVIRLLKPFNCQILITDIIAMPEYCQQECINQVDLTTLLNTADIVSLHVPVTRSTVDLINTNTLQQMQKTAYLINTARGAIVNQTALKHALMNSEIAGAALDVYKEEPPEDKEFLHLPNLLCTPHIAGNAYEAELAMGMAAIAGLEETRQAEDFL